MKVATGKVIDGKVVVEGTALDEGAMVTVLARDDDGWRCKRRGGVLVEEDRWPQGRARHA